MNDVDQLLKDLVKHLQAWTKRKKDVPRNAFTREGAAERNKILGEVKKEETELDTLIVKCYREGFIGLAPVSVYTLLLVYNEEEMTGTAILSEKVDSQTPCCFITEYTCENIQPPELGPAPGWTRG